ncbi:MAG: PspC domain-containing protein [Clostridia bacterium]|nr:PspC domain-containing protein [Clostridia bacterium]
MAKKLYKDTKHKKICGVCAGISEYLDIDVTVIRLLWVIFGCLGGAGFVAYIMAAFIMPDKGDYLEDGTHENE